MINRSRVRPSHAFQVSVTEHFQMSASIPLFWPQLGFKLFERFRHGHLYAKLERIDQHGDVVRMRQILWIDYRRIKRIGRSQFHVADRLGTQQHRIVRKRVFVEMWFEHVHEQFVCQSHVFANTFSAVTARTAWNEVNFHVRPIVGLVRILGVDETETIETAQHCERTDSQCGPLSE